MPKTKEPVICPMCLHEYAPEQTTRHHLVPKSRGGRVMVPFCKPCHNQIHAVYTEKELELCYGTIEELLQAEKLQGWIKWIRKRKPTGRIQVKTSKNKGRRKY